LNETEHDLHRMRRFTMAADYMRTNGFTTPFFSFAIAGILWQWFPAWQVFSWAALTSVCQIAMGLVAHWSFGDRDHPAHMVLWRRWLIAAAILAGCVFGAAILVFYVPGERLNNILLIAMGVASVATLAAMTSPDRGLMVAATGPFVIVLPLVMLWNEAYPYNLILGAMAVLYCAETFVTANKLSGMVGRLVGLQIGNDKLIDSLAQEKRDADQARIRAENASKAKSNFLANMSHELRTPLNAILGFSEIIRDRAFGEQAMPRYAAYASDIHTSGAHLLNLINDILDLSRIEAGKWELQEERIAIPDLFGAVLKLHAVQAATQGVTLVTENTLDGDLFADRKALSQILVNLVSNAVKFTPPGGRVTMHAWREADAVCIDVADTGAGILPEDMPRVLERFGQAQHDVAIAGQKGVGLGLPIVKGLVEAHGGTLAIESKPGKGTRVLVRLPASRGVPAAKAA
jgi:two-component system, cell cycle sensor histidine kinase PleC